MTTDLKTMSDLIRTLSVSDKRQALSMLASELIGEKQTGFFVPVTHGGKQLNYGFFPMPTGKIETLNPQPGDKYYERSQLAKNPANLGNFDSLLDDLPVD